MGKSKKPPSIQNLVKKLNSKRMHTNDKIMCRFTNWLADKCRISLDPTASRWGFVSIFLTTSFFSLSLFLALLAIHFSINGGKLVPSTVVLWVALAFGIGGIALLVAVIKLATHLLANPDKDPIAKDIREINETLKLMNKNTDKGKEEDVSKE